MIQNQRRLTLLFMKLKELRSRIWRKNIINKHKHTFQDIQVEVDSSKCWLFCITQWPKLTDLWLLGEFGGWRCSSRKFGFTLHSSPVWRIDETHQLIYTGGWTQTLFQVWRWWSVLKVKTDTFTQNTAFTENYYIFYNSQMKRARNTFLPKWMIVKLYFCKLEISMR